MEKCPVARSGDQIGLWTHYRTLFQSRQIFVSNISKSHSEPVEERLLRPQKRSQSPFDGLRMIVRLANGEVSGSQTLDKVQIFANNLPES
jgi:hypothetical protein